MPTYTIRRAEITELPTLQALFKHTVLTVNLRDYTREEVEDWASCADDPAFSAACFRERTCFIAENETGECTGFASISTRGHLHMLFVHSAFQRQGVATKLYTCAENWARTHGAQFMTAEVSRTAKPFFEKQGFRVDVWQMRKARHLYLVNYRMRKELTGSTAGMPQQAV